MRVNAMSHELGVVLFGLEGPEGCQCFTVWLVDGCARDTHVNTSATHTEVPSYMAHVTGIISRVLLALKL